MPVRARLLIDQNAPELHALCWEALRDPKNGELIVTRERFLFSRFLSADDWRPVRFRARDEFRALVAIANPSNIGDYKPGGRPLPPLDVSRRNQTRHGWPRKNSIARFVRSWQRELQRNPEQTARGLRYSLSRLSRRAH